MGGGRQKLINVSHDHLFGDGALPLLDPGLIHATPLGLHICFWPWQLSFLFSSIPPLSFLNIRPSLLALLSSLAGTYNIPMAQSYKVLGVLIREMHCCY